MYVYIKYIYICNVIASIMLHAYISYILIKYPHKLVGLQLLNPLLLAKP